jgi:hypothetical protein
MWRGWLVRDRVQLLHGDESRNCGAISSRRYSAGRRLCSCQIPAVFGGARSDQISEFHPSAYPHFIDAESVTASQAP